LDSLDCSIIMCEESRAFGPCQRPRFHQFFPSGLVSAWMINCHHVQRKEGFSTAADAALSWSLSSPPPQCTPTAQTSSAFHPRFRMFSVCGLRRSLASPCLLPGVGYGFLLPNGLVSTLEGTVSLSFTECPQAMACVWLSCTLVPSIINDTWQTGEMISCLQ